MENFWALPVNQVFKKLETSPMGLTTRQAQERLKNFGPNEVAKKEERPGFKIFFSQFKNSLVLILIFAAIISYFLGQHVEATVILAIVFLNSFLSFIQEYKAEKVIQQLKKYLTLKARVLRNGEIAEIDSVQIVPGDLVLLKIGDLVPADIRLTKVNELTTNESLLTGESLPVEKTATKISSEKFLPQDLKNIAFAGTAVCGGEGQGIVIATGKNTYFGKTAACLKQTIPESDFQKSLKKFSNFLLKVILAMTAFIFAANAFLGKEIFESFLFALALAVGITPEVLPVIMTITLSSGALAMSKKKVVCKRLASVENLGNMDTLCCDKTGTLTEGKMTLADSLNPNGSKNENLIIFGLLCNSIKEGKLVLTENPIDRSIWKSKESQKFVPQLKEYQLIDENPFSFERRRASVVVQKDQKKLFLAKGAPESIFGICKSVSPEIRKKITDFQEDGYTVIALAQKEFLGNKTVPADEKDLNLLGFLLFQDPPKKTAKESIKMFQKLKVNIKILSGDSPITTRKICQEVGLEIFQNEIILGDQLEKMNEDDFRLACQKYNVFARVTPVQKMRIVGSLNKEGHIVGFLGDGINDAPALKAADVGISVNSGAQIAKEAADIILLQKSLKVLATGIVEGRKTFGNITKYILNTISANWGNMFTVAFSSLFMNFIPLLPSQILLNNFITDTPMVAISTDNVDQEFIKKPKRWNLHLISRFMIYFGLISSFYDLALILPLLLIFKIPTSLFRTAWFLESALSEIVSTFAIRSKFPFYQSSPSRLLVITSILALFWALFIVHSRIGLVFFEFEKPTLAILILIGAILVTYFFSLEFAKRSFFKKFEI